ncbi:MAG: hypothetical protein KIT31_39240 [Deltaproteobacteria bacterium]|nr:hypothetical protein [Deltaproteobacteria bacterium]
MKKVALGALFAGLAACGGGGSNNDNVIIVDAAPGDSVSGVCNPLMNTGCNAGEKCTWIRDQVTPQPVGHIGCAPDGTIPLNGTNCAAPGGLGADLCVAKSICIGAGESSTCEAVCDPQAAAASSGCEVGQTSCSRYSGLFVVSGAIAFGACDPVCDPLLQKQLGATPKDFCGGDGTNRGCYGGLAVFTCAGTPMEARTIIDGQNAFGPTPNGNDAFVNGCAAGNVPFFFDRLGSMQVNCTGMCAPSANGTVHSGNATQAKGDPAATGFLLGATPLVGPGNVTCAIGKKGGGVRNLLECRRTWPFNNDGMQFLPGPFNNSLGVCFDPIAFQDPADPDGIPPGAFGNSPQCINLTEAQANMTPGCGDDTTFVSIPVPGKPSPHQKFLNARVGLPPGQAVRHQFQ